MATKDQILRLDVKIGEALNWILISTLHIIWTHRSKGRQLNLYLCKAILLADVIILNDINQLLASEINTLINMY